MEIKTRHDATSIACSLMRQQAEQYETLKEEMAKNFWPIIGTANQCAFMAMDDAMEAMQDCGMLRQQVKVKAQKAVREYEQYDRAVVMHFRDVDNDRFFLWADLVTRAATRLQPDVTKLYYAIKNVIDAKGVDNSVALAKIQTAMALISLSVLMFDTLADQFQRRTMLPIADTFRGGRLSAVERCWKAVGDLTGRQVLQQVDLSNDETCQLGINVILTRYQSAEFLNEAAGEALEHNQQFQNYVKQ